jgi:hypothetical protein
MIRAFDRAISNLDTENIHIALHELGHTFALDGMFPLLHEITQGDFANRRIGLL